MNATAKSKTMSFHEVEGSSFIQLKRYEKGGYAFFDVKASFEGFTGRNKEIIFGPIAKFLDVLGELDAKRDGRVKLEGTEGSWLSLSTFDSAGHLRVDLRLGQYKNDHRYDGPTTKIAVEGGFPLDAEYTNQIFRNLREFL